MLEPILRLGPPPRNVEPRRMKALVMRSHFAFDDTANDLPPFAHKKIPLNLKSNDRFSIPAGTEGYLVEQKGEYGWGLFYRNGSWYNVILPMNVFVTGKTWRPLQGQVTDNAIGNPVLRSWTRNLQATPLENYIRSFWLCLRSQRELLLRCGLHPFIGHDIFGSSFQANVDSIISAFTAPAKAALQNGVNITTLSQLPKVSQQWPAPGCKVIYIRLYTHQNNANIDDCAIYGGQSKTHLWRRHLAHQSNIDNNSPHYNYARRSSPHHRHMIPIMIWDAQVADSIRLTLVNMAEQTVIAMFNSYHGWVKRPPGGGDVFSYRLHFYNHFTAIDSANQETRTKTTWSYSAPAGCNAESPMFDKKARTPIYCYPQRVQIPGQRSKTVYRLPMVFQKEEYTTKGVTRYWLQRYIPYTTSDGTHKFFRFRVPHSTVQRLQMPDNAKAYLVFETMDDGQPHDIPYAGCPNVGPFKNFGAANRLGVHYEWLDETSGNFIEIPLQLGRRSGDFLTAVKNSDMMKAIAHWRRATDIMQLLEGIDYQGDCNGLSRSLHLTLCHVRMFSLDHLNQSIRWIPRPRQSRPAPELASFRYNAQLMNDQHKGTYTLVNVKEPPPIDSDFWRFTSHDVKVMGQKAVVKCDLCYYMHSFNVGYQCERDPEHEDRWVCKCCSTLNRPCTFTPRSQCLVLWGSDRPFLFAAGDTQNSLGWYPTGPHRFLAFHATLTPDRQAQGQRIEPPIEGRGGLDLVYDMAIMDAEEEVGGVEDCDEGLEEEA
ncbi:hypothetical protein FSARC_11120 [Fusarium sarcochroum]|uniref:Uncharacterized protein n=1 Tax=Fusarium sarcochroum TaxID=1208366 RepID=A0A8H4X1Q4_9HYPO|nr:hypothetical protein FSARC_11120 [Fusarium sarcochroum]